MRARPTGLLVVCILCIILGALGIVGSLFGVAGAFATEGLMDMQMAMMAGAPPEMRDAFAEYAADLQRIQRDRLPVHLAIAVVNLVLSVLLLVGSIRCLKWKPAGRSMLAAACAASILYQVAATASGIEAQLATTEALDRYMRAMGNAGPGGNPMAGMGSAMSAIGVAVAVVWGVLLEAVYVWCFLYLRKRATRALFEPAAEGTPAPGSAA